MKCKLCEEEMVFVGWQGMEEQEEEVYVCICGMEYGSISGWWHTPIFKKIEEEEYVNL